MECHGRGHHAAKLCGGFHLFPYPSEMPVKEMELTVKQPLLILLWKHSENTQKV